MLRGPRTRLGGVVETPAFQGLALRSPGSVSFGTKLECLCYWPIRWHVDRRDRDMDDSRIDFEAVVNAHGPGMFRYAFWLCGDRSMAEDLAQETLLRAWRFRDGLNDKGKVKAWLITTLRREHARLFERYRPEFVDLEPEQLADPRARTGNEWQSWDLRRAIARLPERLREPLVLQVIFGCSGLEISEALGLPRSTVNTRLFRARQKLCDLTAEKSHASTRQIESCAESSFSSIVLAVD